MAIISEFYKKLRDLCEERNMTVNEFVKILNLSSGSPTAWKNGTIPRDATLAKIADYFGVTTDYLDCKGKEITPALNERDRRDIAKNLEQMLADLESNGDLMFDGNPMSDEARESIRQALQMGLEIAKVKNKERFTPKKYREG